MKTVLHVELTENEGALLRLIGLVERRGFTIASLNKTTPNHGCASVTMEVAPRPGVRQVNTLIRQIARLWDVQDVFAPDLQVLPTHIPANGGETCEHRC